MIPTKTLRPLFAICAMASLQGLPASAAAVHLGFDAELTAQQNGRYIVDYDENGDPVFEEHAGLYSDHEVGDVLRGTLTLSGSNADLAALFADHGGSSWSGSSVTVECVLGSVDCGGSDWTAASLGLFGGELVTYADFGETVHHFDLSLAGSDLQVAQTFGIGPAPSDGEMDYAASFRLTNFSLGLTPDRVAGPMVARMLDAPIAGPAPMPVPAALPMGIGGIVLLTLVGRRRTPRE